MKRSLLQAAIVIGLAASAIPASAGGRVGGFARGFPVRMAPVRIAPPLRAAAPRIAIAPPLPGLGLRPFPAREPRSLFFGQRPLEGGFERARFDRRRFGERWRRWRGLPVYASSIGTGYPYPTGDDDPSLAAPYAAPPQDYNEHYVSSAGSLSLQQQPQYNPGPRIIYIHAPRADRHAKPLPTVIYGIQPQPAYDGVPSAPPLH